VLEQFSDQAREVVVYAMQEAIELRHDYVGSEALLLGLLAAPTCRAAIVLRELGATAPDARLAVRRTVRGGDHDPGRPRAIPFTPRAKKVLENSLAQMHTLGRQSIQPEHLLLGMTDEDDSIALRILLELGINRQTIRDRLLSGPGQS
jgi:ATP-dependent Clp protease ATP-binding subunit ClpC